MDIDSRKPVLFLEMSMSHKILIELDEEQEAFVRKLADYCKTSVSKVVQSIVDQGLVAPMRTDGFFNREQK